MIRIEQDGKRGYCPDMGCDPLAVEKGFCHFRCGGQKDFLSKMFGYSPEDAGAVFDVETFRKRRAQVRITFVGETAFRFQMFPVQEEARRLNEVFSFAPYGKAETEENEDFVFVTTKRVTIACRKCPWEITVILDGRELTKEQIRDHNVDQKYKAVPVGFTVAEDGRVTDAFETMYLYSDETFYGFGEKFTDFNKRGQKITIWQRDAQSTNSDVSYKGMPYFMSSSGYSILMNTFTRTHFNMGATSGVSYTMETEDSYLDYYMFCNRDYKGLIRDYTSYSGRSDMIPRWAFGFWMSRMSYINRREVEEVIEKMEDFGMSVDVIHIDGWLNTMDGDDGEELLEFDENRFPDPEGMIAWLREKGVHLSLWMFPYVQYKSMWGYEQGNAEPKQYQLMKRREFLVKNREGEPYLFSLGEGDVAGASVAALDFTNPKLVSYMKERVKRLIKMGVGVMKTDFSEELPEDAVFYDGTTGLESHNKYTLLYAKTIYEASREAKAEMGERALLWGRSGYAGSQNYPANWAGDSSAAENNLAAILNGGLSIGISGVSFWGFDIGGFYNCDYEGKRSLPSAEEYIRSVQMGLMSPLSRSHGQSTPREPWHFSQEVQEAFLYANKLRYRMLPYIYSTAWETHREGLPMMRAMLLEFQEDLNVRHLSSQYMLGGALLVAPVFDQQVHHVYLPEGSWIELAGGRRITGGRWISVPKEFQNIPLFLRENSMLPVLAEAPDHIAEENFENLTVILNLAGTLKQSYYDDGIEGGLEAAMEDGTLNVVSKGMDIAGITAYLPEPPKRAVVNGSVWSVEKAGEAYRIQK